MGREPQRGGSVRCGKNVELVIRNTLPLYREAPAALTRRET